MALVSESSSAPMLDCLSGHSTRQNGVGPAAADSLEVLAASAHPLTAGHMLDDTPLFDLLRRHVAPHVRWHRQRLRFLAAFLPALIELGTVNLAKLSLALGAKPASNYRRIQRFFAEATLPQRAAAAFVLHLLPTRGRLVVAIDRTTWHFGQTPIDIFPPG